MAWSEQQIEEMGRRAAHRLPVLCPDDSERIKVYSDTNMEGTTTLILVCMHCNQQGNYDVPRSFR